MLYLINTFISIWHKDATDGTDKKDHSVFQIQWKIFWPLKNANTGKAMGSVGAFSNTLTRKLLRSGINIHVLPAIYRQLLRSRFSSAPEVLFRRLRCSLPITTSSNLPVKNADQGKNLLTTNTKPSNILHPKILHLIAPAKS